MNELCGFWIIDIVNYVRVKWTNLKINYVNFELCGLWTTTAGLG